ncbi:hypothetical protein FNV43_RR04450 [Rhamnella rubrinervis]|uniref:Uncharacterized protein n=1 Tax=Rhamnella rubrinervis TaxID=2594499 RepID=A0A8K0HJL0_9ROSA|nr:hypothetical protein FNV43_RR04450 [Rhamnella rubrinervis]
MVGIEAYLSIRRHGSDTGLSFFEDDDDSEKGNSDKDFLEDLWGRIQALSSNGWKVDSVPRTHLSFEAQLVAGKSHEFGPINCPDQPKQPSTVSGISYGKQKHDAELRYPQRIRRLGIFPASKIEDLQPIDRFIVEEYLLDVLFYFNGSRKECASFMVGLPVPFRYEYLMAETIFSQILMLPHPPFKPIYYTLVIIDLCKALPGAFPAVVAGAVRALFEKIVDLDMECRTRLILWFSHHLSNFQFIWPWEEWAYVLDLPRWAPQRVFVQEVLEREVRLSYWDKVKQSIENAPGLEELLPPKGGPNFKFSGEDSSEHALSAEISNLVKGRAAAQNIEQFHMSDRPWEILRNAVSKTFNRLCDLRKEISSLNKSIVLAEEAAAKAKTELDDAESKLTLVDGEPVLGENPVRLKRLKSYAEKAKEEEMSVRESLEAKEALLTRALDENEALFLSLYKNFSTVLMERLPDASRAGAFQELKSIYSADSMAVDVEESTEMEVDNENGRPKKRFCSPFHWKEKVLVLQCHCVPTFSRQYASEIWPHIDKLDAEILTADAHPLFRKAIMGSDGLGARSELSCNVFNHIDIDGEERVERQRLFTGIVKSYDPSSGLFEVVYEDGDSEQLNWAETSLLIEGKVQVVEEEVKPSQLGRKPKKRRRLEKRLEVPGESGNAGEAFLIDGVGREEILRNFCGFVGDLNEKDNSHDGSEVNLEMGNGVGENLRAEVVVNGHLNENVNSGDSGENLRKRDCIDLNLDVNGDFDENLNVDVKANASVVALDTNYAEDCGLVEVQLKDDLSGAVTQMVHGHLGDSGSPCNQRSGRRKRRKLSDSIKSTTATVLRRSTRRGSAQHHVSLPFAVNDTLSSPGVYACLRSFSTLLFLSPFELEDFVAALHFKFPSSLFDNVHVSILQILRKHVEYLSNEGSESAAECLRSLNWDFLDVITWPIFMVEYLLFHSTGLKPGFDLSHLKLFDDDYYQQPTPIKVEILRVLCDDLIEVEAIRSELNRRSLAAAEPDMVFERNINFEVCKKRRTTVDVSSGFCLNDEVVDDSTDWNSDECCLCKMDGSLICCDGCPAAYHSKCVGIVNDLLPEGDWFCPECAIDRRKSWTKPRKSLRGADLLGIDPHGRLYFNSCGYLLVSDSFDAESSFSYYHKDDLNMVLEVLNNNDRLYRSMSLEMHMKERIPVLSNAPVPMASSATCAAKDETDAEEKWKKTLINKRGSGIGYDSNKSVKFLNQSDILGNLLPVGDCSLTSSTFDMRRGTNVESSGPENPLSTLTTKTGYTSQVQCGIEYMNYYSFGKIASSVAEELLDKSSEKKKENSVVSEEEIILQQTKAILKRSSKFCWSSIQNLNIDAEKEKFGVNLSRLALSCEWLKHVDSAVSVGSASHIVTSFARASSKYMLARKGLGVQIMNPTLLQMLPVVWECFGGGWYSSDFQLEGFATLLGFQGCQTRSNSLLVLTGCVKIPGVSYPENSECKEKQICCLESCC